MKYKFSKNSFNNLRGVNPLLVAVLVTAIGDKRCPFDWGISSGLRSLGEQQELYAKGRTTGGRIVTNADGINNKSNHQAKGDDWGYAIDYFGYVGKLTYDSKIMKAIWQHIDTVAKEMGIELEWGGNWKTFKDRPHIELTVKRYR